METLHINTDLHLPREFEIANIKITFFGVKSYLLPTTSSHHLCETPREIIHVDNYVIRSTKKKVYIFGR